MNRLLLTLLLLLAWSPFSRSQWTRLELTDDYLNIYLEATNQPSFQILRSSFRFEQIEPRIREKMGSYSIKRRPNARLQKVAVKSVTNLQIELEVNKIPLYVKLQEEHLSFSSDSTHLPPLQFEIKKGNEERFYGGGVQYSHPCFEGKTFENITEENGLGRGDQPISRWTRLVGVAGSEHSTYFPLARFVSTQNRGFEIEGYGSSYLKFDPEEIHITMDASSAIHFLKRTNRINVIRDFTKKNDTSLTFPSWAMGTILGAQGGTNSVLKKVGTLQKVGTQIDAVWIQDWVGKRDTRYGQRLNWIWQLDSTNYPDFQLFRNQLRTRGTRLLGYVNPFFAEEGHYISEGLKEGYFLKNKDGKAKLFDYGGMGGYMLDIFDADAFNWMKDIINRELVGQGFDGWMADFAEWYPVKNQMDIEQHNLYTFQWQALNHQILAEYQEKHQDTAHLWIFHRSGAGDEGYRGQSIWAGDQFTNYGEHDGLPSAFKAYQSTGISGLGIIHSDIGGYTGVKKPIIHNVLREEGLLLDWMRMEALTPVFRTHEGLLPHDNIQVYSNDEIAREFAKWSAVNRALRPYFQSLLNIYKVEGIPLYIHPMLFDQVQGKGEKDLRMFVGKDLCIDYIEKEDNQMIEPPLHFIRLQDDLSFQEGAFARTSNQRIQLYVRAESNAHDALKELSSIWKTK